MGLNGKDGKDGLTIRGANGQDGVNGTNGTNGITRIVYEDKTNNKHEVATLDDGLKFTGNNTDTVNNHKLNSLVKVQGEGVDKTTSASFKSASGNINVKADGTDTLEVQLNKDLKNITSIKNDGPATMTIGGNEFKFDGGNVNMGGNNITNLKSGGDVIDNAANIGDVKRISKANDLHIAPTSSNRQGETTTSYAYDAASKSVTLKYNDGNGVNQSGTVAKIDLSGLADQIKDGYSFSTDAKGNVVGNHAVTAVGNGKTVSYAAGDNLTVKQDIDATTGEHTYTYALSNDIKVCKDMTNEYGLYKPFRKNSVNEKRLHSMDAIRYQMMHCVMESLRSATNWKQFQDGLALVGIRCRFRYNKKSNGIEGISFSIAKDRVGTKMRHDVSFSGKQLDPSLTLDRLCQKLGNPLAIVHEQARDMYEDARLDWIESRKESEVRSRIDTLFPDFNLRFPFQAEPKMFEHPDYLGDDKCLASSFFSDEIDSVTLGCFCAVLSTTFLVSKA